MQQLWEPLLVLGSDGVSRVRFKAFLVVSIISEHIFPSYFISHPLLTAGMLCTKGHLAEPSVGELEISTRSKSSISVCPTFSLAEEAIYFPDQAENASQD